MKHLGDITKIHGDQIEPTWCVVGGSPCQDLSVAGKRAGIKHSELGDGETTRSGLYMDQLRIVKEMRSIERTIEGTDVSVRLPRYLVWENVPGALSSNFNKPGGEQGFGDFGAVLEEAVRVVEPGFSLPRLEGKQKWTKAGLILGNHWSIAWRIHDAQYAGVAQRRRRICMLCDYDGYTAGDIVFERRDGPMESGWSSMAIDLDDTDTINASEMPNEPICVKLSDILEPAAPEKYNLSEKACRGILSRAAKRGKQLPDILKRALESIIRKHGGETDSSEDEYEDDEDQEED